MVGALGLSGSRHRQRYIPTSHRDAGLAVNVLTSSGLGKPALEPAHEDHAADRKTIGRCARHVRFTPESGHWVTEHKARKQDFANQFQALRDSLRDQFFELNEIRKQFSKLLG